MLGNLKLRKINIRFLIIIFFLFYIFSCKVEEFAKIKSKEINYPDLVLKNYKHYIYKNKKKYLFANINEAEFHEKDLKIICNRIKAEIYDSDEKLTTMVNSERGEIDKDKKILTFIGNVNIELLENNASLFCDELKLDYENNRLISDTPVILKKKDGSYIQADAMESDLKLEATKFVNMRIKYYYDEDKK